MTRALGALLRAFKLSLRNVNVINNSEAKVMHINIWLILIGVIIYDLILKAQIEKSSKFITSYKEKIDEEIIANISGVINSLNEINISLVNLTMKDRSDR